MARYLGITHMLTNRFETDADGILTGRVVRPILRGPGKATAVQQFAGEDDIDLAKSYFYADGDEDVALDVFGRQSRLDEPGARWRRNRHKTRLADPAVHQPRQSRSATG